MKSGIKILVTISVFLVFTGTLSAIIAPPPPTTGATPPCWPPPCIPIDGGISILAIAGAAYASKKLYDKRKKDSSVSDVG